ncbi:MAG: DUF58 domain-containing protein [Treponema sp.]|jgi:uncharacterized protein (DUF58 family)|nr:DUF58 domain-containing protein [Treponema sp.]
MTRHELLRKITAFPIVASGLAEDLLAGGFRSVFRGQGIEADEVRRYEMGDDVRSIDWNVSARFGTPYVKMYREERELSVFIALDCSASMHCGSVMKRSEQAVLAAALLAFSAEHSGQRLGSVFFDTGISRMFPAGKGRPHTLAVITGALRECGIDMEADGKYAKYGGMPEKKEKNPKGEERSSNLGAALAGLERMLKRRSLIFVISDFFCMNWEQELGRLCRKHDVVAIRITDPLDAILYNAGLVVMEDPETGAKIHAPTAFASFRAAWENWHRERGDAWKAITRRAGASPFELSTKEDAAASFIRFFKSRRR